MSRALQHAAANAWDEVAGLRAEAEHAMTLEGQSDILYDAATDAINAYTRARERARAVQQLASQSLGEYNAWEDR